MLDRINQGRFLCNLILLMLLTAGLTGAGREQIAHADDPAPVIRYDVRLIVQPNGDMDREEQLIFPSQIYTIAQMKLGGPKEIYRAFQKSFGWSLIEKCEPTLDAPAHRVLANFRHVGAARPLNGDRWYLELDSAAQMELLAVNGTELILAGAAASDFGVISYTTRLKLPPGSSNPKAINAGQTIEFEYLPRAESGPKVATSFRLDTKPHLMTSLAAVYSNRGFAGFWTARSVFHNKGDQAISNYRVRFRIEGHSTWSEWSRASRIVPGQTIVDPFFPVFELESIARLTTSRFAMVEAEFEYQKANGETVKDTEKQRIELLSRNQAVFSSRSDGEHTTWLDHYDQIPYIVASYCNSDDPVVQQFAGRISGMANGPAASEDDASAVAYLSAIWSFMQSNGISYQTPPGFSLNGTSGQHIKYPRDVLKNRAGTCVDLAIFWASLARAVGLEAHVIVTPGHAFPLIKLPGGGSLPIESTLIGSATFEDAIEVGSQKLAEAVANPSQFVSIDQLQNKGVRCLDLAPVSDTWLSTLNYRFTGPVPATGMPAEVPSNAQEATNRDELVNEQKLTLNAKDNGLLPHQFMGVWRGESWGFTRLIWELRIKPSRHTTIKIYELVDGEQKVYSVEEAYLLIENDRMQINYEDGRRQSYKFVRKGDKFEWYSDNGTEEPKWEIEFTKVPKRAGLVISEKLCHTWKAQFDAEGVQVQAELEILAEGKATLELSAEEDGSRKILDSLNLTATVADDEILLVGEQGLFVRKYEVEGDTLRWYACDENGEWSLQLEFVKERKNRWNR